MIRIVTDTAVSLPPEVIHEHQITLLGGYIIFGDEKLVDYFQIGPEEFYERLADSPGLPTVEDPGPDEFKVLYRSLIQRFPEAELLSIHCTSKMAATVNSARVAAASFPGVTIRLFDTLSIGAAQGLMVWEAARLADSGAAMDDIITRLVEMRDAMKFYFALDTLEFVARSGRVGPVERLVSGLLDIKPVLTLREGMVEPFGQQRSRAKALESLRDMVLKEGMGRSGLRIGVMHAACEADARDIAGDVERLLKPEVMLVSPLSPGIGATTGPGALGVCWYAPPYRS